MTSPEPHPLTSGYVLLTTALIVTLAAPALAATTPVFQRTWNRQDLPVEQGIANRSWTWGPALISAVLNEPYYNAPGNQRQAQFFDKSRGVPASAGVGPEPADAGTPGAQSGVSG